MMENTDIKQEIEEITVEDLGGLTTVSQDVMGILEDFEAYEEINKRSNHMSAPVAAKSTEKNNTNKVIYAPSMSDQNNCQNHSILSALLAEKPNEKYCMLPESPLVVESTMVAKNGINNYLPNDTSQKKYHSTTLAKNKNDNSSCRLANDVRAPKFALSPSRFEDTSPPRSKYNFVKSINDKRRQKVQTNTKVRPKDNDQSSLLETFFQREQPSNLVSELQHIYFQNNITSSDEDEDVINEEANKLRMRNGLAPVNWRKIRSNANQCPKAQRQTSSEESRNVVDSNPSSPSDVLVIDESLEEADTESVISVSSSTRSSDSPIIRNQNVYSKRTRNDLDEEYSRSSKEMKVRLTSSQGMQYATVRYPVLEDVGLATSSTTYSTDTVTISTDSTTAVTCKTVTFQQILNNIQNLKKESDDSISAEYKTGSTSKPDSQATSTIGTYESQHLDPKESEKNILKIESQFLDRDTLKNTSNSTQTVNIESVKCNSSEHTKNNLSAHLLSSEVIANQSYKCVPCKLTFTAHLQLKKHILSVHIRLFQCPKCDFRTLMPFKLQEHLQIHNGNESSGSLSPLRIKQLSSSSRSSASSTTNSPIGIVETE